jgi:thioredoxin reductase
MQYDVVIVGGGPAGLAAALALGRARKRVLLCDAGARRNAAATHIYNFVTRDGTPPDEFRDLAREQLKQYTTVAVRDVRVQAIAGERGAFRVQIEGEALSARRVLLCVGMIDEMLPLPGFRELWGASIFQCPYCHGFEVADQRWGVLAPADSPHLVPFSVQALGWTSNVTVFTSGGKAMAGEAHAQLKAAGIAVHTAAVTRLIAQQNKLTAVELEDGSTVACDVLFAHPPQKQVELVQSLGLALDDDGFVRVDAMRRETSLPGVYAAGDLITRMQAAVMGAAAGAQAAAMLNMDLALERAQAAVH